MAQNIPLPPKIEDESLPSRIQEDFPELEKFDPLSLPGGLDQLLLDAPSSVKLRSISFSGNTKIKDKTVQSVLKPYEGKTLPIQTLNEIESAITTLYLEQGFAGSGAFISRQSRFEGDLLDLHLQIIEAKISALEVKGAGRLKPFVKKQLSNLRGNVIQSEALLTDIRFLLQDPRVQDVAVTINPTPRLDQKQLSIEVDTAKPWSITGLLNNGRSPSVGSFERGVSAQHLNLLGFGDRLALDYRNTDGSNIVGVGYDIPVTNSGGKLAFNYLYGNTEIVAEPLAPFEIQTRTQQFAIDLSQPVFRKSSDNMLQELVMGLGFNRTENEDSILGQAFPVTEGANLNGRIRSSRIDFSQRFSRRTKQNQLIFNSVFGFGVDLGTTNDPNLGDGSFFKWSGQGLFAQEVIDKLYSISSVNMQVADRDVIGNEQFALGGRGSVRGFLSNQIARTNGINLSQEFRYRALDQEDHQLDIATFFDFGSAWNDEPQIAEFDETLGSIGFGLTYQFEGIRASIEYGIPLFGPQRQGNSLQGDGLLMSLQFTF